MKADEAVKISKDRLPIFEKELLDENRKRIYKMIQDACNEGSMMVSGAGIYPGHEIEQELINDGYFTDSSYPNYFFVYWGEYAERQKIIKEENDIEYNKKQNKKSKKWYKKLF
jgi:hypothetical protein